jgi:hypothetical protein
MKYARRSVSDSDIFESFQNVQQSRSFGTSFKFPESQFRKKRPLIFEPVCYLFEDKHFESS